MKLLQILLLCFLQHSKICIWTGLETPCPAFGQVLRSNCRWSMWHPWGWASSWVRSISVDEPINHSQHPEYFVSKSAKIGSFPPLYIGFLIPVPVPCALLCQHSCLSGFMANWVGKLIILKFCWITLSFLQYYSSVRTVFLTWLLRGSAKSWTCRKLWFCTGAVSRQMRLAFTFRTCLNQKKQPHVKATDN